MNRFFFVALLALSPVLSVQADASSRSQESAATATAQVTLPAGEWGTQIDYDYSVERPDQLSQVARNGEVSRLSFATLQRSFGTGNFRPYLGVGVGQASARFEAVERGAQRAETHKMQQNDVLFRLGDFRHDIDLVTDLAGRKPTPLVDVEPQLEILDRGGEHTDIAIEPLHLR